MPIKLALIGNPNCGKTTLFNILTGANQTIGNWPGVTVEKKEGRLIKDKSVFVYDLPGIYSMSPYSPEEKVVKNYLEKEDFDVIINIIDATNAQRNLYLTTQLLEQNRPMVIALNMMDVVHKRGDYINTNLLKKLLGCEICEISAFSGSGIDTLISKAIDAVKTTTKPIPVKYSNAVENVLSYIRANIASDSTSLHRLNCIKLFEKDKAIAKKLHISKSVSANFENKIKAVEKQENDTSENIIINQRYEYIGEIFSRCFVLNKHKKKITITIDKVLTNRYLAFPIFITIMAFIYMTALGGVGRSASHFISNNLFENGWHLFGIGTHEYEQSEDSFNLAQAIIEQFVIGQEYSTVIIKDENNNITEKLAVTKSDYNSALKVSKPDPKNYGIWIPGLSKLVLGFLTRIRCSRVITELICNGIITGVGAVLAFLPQMLILFFFLAFLEDCGYMSRVVFITDKALRKFGLSGKSFIPIVLGTGCSVPGIMATRTIESESDKMITVATTSFMPCSAKLPIIALMCGMFFSNGIWVAPSVYIISIMSVLVSGVLLKKIKPFSGKSMPFVMEMPDYHMPKPSIIFKNVSERIRSFLIKAGTVIVIASVIIWFLSNFGYVGHSLTKTQISDSFLSGIGKWLAPLFKPIGWGHWQLSVAAISGIAAKENIVTTLHILFTGNKFLSLSQMLTMRGAYSFMIFNILCAPCFAAITAIFKESVSKKKAMFAIAYQCVFAYAVSFIVFNIEPIYLIAAIALLLLMIILKRLSTKQ